MRNHIISIINDQQFQSPITNLLEHNHKKNFPRISTKKNPCVSNFQISSEDAIQKKIL